MSNKSTHKDQRIPYTYLIGWSKLDKWYYGRRTAKCCHPSEFWISYFTSSKHVRNFRKIYGEPDIIEIRKTFSNTKTCCEWENKVIKRILSKDQTKWLNKKYGDKEFDTTGFSNWVDEHGNIFHLMKDDPLIKELSLISFFSYINSGSATYINVLDPSDIRRLKPNDPRVLNGEYVGRRAGKTSPFKDKTHTDKSKSLIAEKALHKKLALFKVATPKEMYELLIDIINKNDLYHKNKHINQYGKYNLSKVNDILSPNGIKHTSFFKRIIKMFEA